MKKRIIFIHCIVVGMVLLTACNLPGFSAGQPTLDIIAVQHVQNTIIAEMTLSAPTQSTPTMEPTPQPGTLQTATQSSSIPNSGETPDQQPTPTETIQPTASIPMVTVSVDTNCRYGPHIVYDYLGAVMVGERTEIIGRHPTGGWLLVNNPDRVGQTCWITMQYAEVSGDLNQVPEAPLPAFYDWNGTWTFVQFQVVVDGALNLVQNGNNVSGVVNLSGGEKITYSGTLSENGQIFSGTITLDRTPPSTHPVYFKMLENMNQFIGGTINAQDYSTLRACGYRNGVGYSAGCPLPTAAP